MGAGFADFFAAAPAFAVAPDFAEGFAGFAVATGGVEGGVLGGCGGGAVVGGVEGVEEAVGVDGSEGDGGALVPLEEREREIVMPGFGECEAVVVVSVK